jgi:hypothetical protein
MAHFARIQDNIVREVIVINNEVITDANGQEQESLGVEFCKSLYGQDTEWIQTSYNGSFRGRYAGSGMKYDPELDEFVTPTIEE